VGLAVGKVLESTLVRWAAMESICGALHKQNWHRLCSKTDNTTLHCKHLCGNTALVKKLNPLENIGKRLND